MDLGVSIEITDETDLPAAFGQAREAGWERGQVALLIHGITPDDVRDVAVAAQYAGFWVDAVWCPVNPLRPDDAFLSGVDMTDWRVVAANMSMMNGVERLVSWSGTRGKMLDVPSLLNSEPDTFRILYTALHGMVEAIEGLGIRILLVPHTAHVLCDAMTASKMTRQFPAGEVRLALDAVLSLPSREYDERNNEAQKFAALAGPLAGLVHLRDILPPEEGQKRTALVGRGGLAWGSYLRTVTERIADVPAVVVGAHGTDEMRAAYQFLTDTLKEYGL